MTHDEAAAILVDALPGRLTPAVRARVRGHLEECEECREVLETIEVLRGAPEHLSVDTIVELATKEGSHAHLATCTACAGEVTACRASIAAARAQTKRLHPFIPAAIAATLTVAVLGYPAYLGVVELPRARQQAPTPQAPRTEARTEAPATVVPDRGEVVLALYLGATRGGQGSAPTIQLNPRAHFVTLLLEPVAPRAAADAEPLLFEIRDRGGHVVWSSETTAGAIRDGHGSQDRLLTLLVPVSTLPPGTYTLSLGRIGQGSGERLIESPFEIIAPAR
ncbi:MAG: zf-HC2 domain-containing protein [Acidobacteria bacterium]|nr:zf-HC2 domain-containing protein [Acidobacteriota bacterium]